MLDNGEKVKATPSQAQVIERWKKKLGKRAFMELLQKLQPAMAAMDAERARKGVEAMLRPNSDARIVRVLPDQQCVDFYSELVEARRRDELQ